MNLSRVAVPDGLSLQVYETGNPDGMPILFIHGFSQCALSWKAQFEDSALASEFRLVAFDIRGHGASDRPEEAHFYADDQQFADDIATVISRLSLGRPVLVGWSYAGRLIGDYVKAYGTSEISGINYVCARTANNPEFNGPGTVHIAGMKSSDLTENIAATRKFLRACFASSPSTDIFEEALAFNMLVSPLVRKAHLSRPLSDGAILSRIDVPVLISQGTEDQLVSEGLAHLTASRIPHAKLSLYKGIGHAPFIEDTVRFNRELAEFVRATLPT
jgi:non-heme chloroperoxidase